MVTKEERGLISENDLTMIPMCNDNGEKFCLKYQKGHRLHGWIFFDNNGQWVTHRMSFAHEIMEAERILEIRDQKNGIPCKG